MCSKTQPLLSLLIFSFGSALTGPLGAETFTTLHSFTASDGASPWAGVILSGNILYGTTPAGGSGNGTVFAVNIDGSGFTNLHTFSSETPPSLYTDDGFAPAGGLVLSGKTLYGTTVGSQTSNGTVFAINTDGTGFTNLHTFTPTSVSGTNSDGARPYAGLVLSGTTLYGTTGFGGSSGWGTIFAVNTNGTAFTNLYTFAGGSDGAYPISGVILSSNTLYGTARNGGTSGNGAIFRINTDGTGFTSLYSFTAFSSLYPSANSDGGGPWAGLALSGNRLYGTAIAGGIFREGTVFAVNTDGTGFTTLHAFTWGGYDGENPVGGLILSSNLLYGTARNGGNGTVFAVNTDGTRFTTLYSFTTTPTFPVTNYDGFGPTASLILTSNILYGTTGYGGSLGYGTVYSLSLEPNIPPELTIEIQGRNAILSWPTNKPGFFGYQLQATSDLPPFANWGPPVGYPPVLINGRNVATNMVQGTQQFYRLVQ